ncbi:8-oxo-dGTP pyrophosphatase MutT (NUDIX family) [Aurantimicrobium minutum]|uniref:NUDIX domain-containing protein n=1 Tax=Aurantimicrobium minutum TaxID=708131 RepID=UPI0024772060|nr:NUDIX domain-containing protein [Aurantimicrobium minutum]MDH6532953.1 8-oxo-dGTP pyrophosphatase MutT (NUDIX family) [Aurantimicrobium minutum]
MSRPAHRRVSRVILLDDADRLLLLLTHSPNLMVPHTRWITPGGGVEDHETHAEAAVRELFEETGLRVDSVGEPFWTTEGTSVFNDGHVQTTHSEYFVLRTPTFEPISDNWMENEFTDISSVRWWHIEELKSSGEPYSPEPLTDLVERALKDF